MNNRRIGEKYEKQAAEFLQRQGLVIIERNYRCKLGEIDLIAQDGTYYVFVEVKYRNGSVSGFAAEAVTKQKQKRISQVAVHYLTVHCHCLDLPCRFDVVGIDGEKVRWIRDAFEFSG